MRAPKKFRHGGKAKVSSIAPRLTAQQEATRQVAAGNRYRSGRRFLGTARCEAFHQAVVLDEPDDRHDEMIYDNEIPRHRCFQKVLYFIDVSQ